MTERVADLDAAAAARAETRGEPPQVRFKGELWPLPAELPAQYGYSLLEGDTKEALQLLLGERFDEFWALRPSRDDLLRLVDAVPGFYGFRPGESSASPTSSETSGSGSRPTSPAATASTSEQPSGVPAGAASG